MLRLRRCLLSILVTSLVAAALPSLAFGFSTGYSSIAGLNSNGGSCLDVAGASTSNGANVQEWGCWGGANQQWQFVSTGTPGFYEVVNKNSGQCLDVANGSTSNGANVQQWGCWGGKQQLWEPVRYNNSYFSLVNYNSGKCLDIASSSTANGTNVQQWGCWNTSGQQWTGGSVSSAYANETSSIDWGIANDNAHTYLSTYSDPLFQKLTTQSALGAAKYQRFFARWDIAGDYSATAGGCVAASSLGSDGAGSNDLADLINALHDAEQAGFTPMISITNDGGYDGYHGYTWPDSSVTTPNNPSDAQMVCGADELGKALLAWGVLPSNAYVESYNEPDVQGIGNACGAYQNDSADCAARYWADVLQGLDYSGWSSWGTNIIAGTFAQVPNGGFNASNPCNQQPSWQAGYVCYLERGDAGPNIFAGGALSAYHQWIYNWSFHDYYDVGHSNACYPGNWGGCVFTYKNNMDALLSSANANGRNVLWITEAGCRYYASSADSPLGGSSCYNLSDNNQQGNEAYDWIQLGYPNYVGVTRVLWYEYDEEGDSHSGWDSALVDWASPPPDGNARQPYCVIGGDAMGFGDPGQTTWNGVSCTTH